MKIFLNTLFVLVFSSFVSFATTALVGVQVSVTDVTGNTYPVVKIGNQWWMADNLKVTKFRNGDPISNPNSRDTWNTANNSHTPGWVNYGWNPQNDALYGKIYNWFAVNDPRGLCPSGWHVPSESEFRTLASTVDSQYKSPDDPQWNIFRFGLKTSSSQEILTWMGYDVGRNLRSTNLWSVTNPIDNGTDLYGFNFRPCGYKRGDGVCDFFGGDNGLGTDIAPNPPSTPEKPQPPAEPSVRLYSMFWLSTQSTLAPNYGYYISLTGGRSDLAHQSTVPGETKGEAYYVRCTSDHSFETTTVAGDIDGNGKAELITQAGNGNVSVKWLNSNGTLNHSRIIYSPVYPTDCLLSAAGDIDGNGRAELLWQCTSGLIVAWWLNQDGTLNYGKSIFSGMIPPSDGWRLAASGDTNGDGRAEILWQSSQGNIVSWWLNPDGSFNHGAQIYSGLIPPSSCLITSASDIDGNGKAELLWQCTSGSIVAWWLNQDGYYNNGAAIYSGMIPPSSCQLLLAGNVDSSLNAELFWQCNNGGLVLWWLNPNGTFNHGSAVNGTNYLQPMYSSVL